MSLTRNTLFAVLEIAAKVFLSDKTVKNYVSSILAKLNLQRRAQAAAFMVRHRPPGGE